MAEWLEADSAPKDGRYVLAKTISTTWIYNAAPFSLVRFQQPHESRDCVPMWITENGNAVMIYKWKPIDD